jgi:hypothetical protein
MLTTLSTVKTRLGLAVTDYDDLLTNAIQAASARFDEETNRTLATRHPPPSRFVPSRAIPSDLAPCRPNEKARNV